MKRLLACLLAAACLLSLASCAQSPQATRAARYVRYAAELPQPAQYPSGAEDFESSGEAQQKAFVDAYNAWDAAREERLNASEGAVLASFFSRTAPQLFAGTDGENRVCSPVNLYLALARLAECTDGETRGQVLQVLDAADIDALRKDADGVWTSSYCDDGLLLSVPAASVWLRDDDRIAYRDETLQVLQKTYHASSFCGSMGTDGYRDALRNWLSEQTGGQLEQQTDNVRMNADTALILAATLQLRMTWSDPFSEELTDTQTFHAPDGDREVAMMHETDTVCYYRAAQYGAVRKAAEDGVQMWLLLPDEGVTPEAVLAAPALFRRLSGDEAAWDSVDLKTLHLSLPRFDVSSGLDLTQDMRALGITDVFDADRADFSPLCGTGDALTLSEATHAARVRIDETGGTGTAFTEMAFKAAAAADEPDDLDFTLDRPFVFVIVSENGLPLFCGIVNRP